MVTFLTNEDKVQLQGEMVKKQSREPVDVLSYIGRIENTMTRVSSEDKVYPTDNSDYFTTDLIYVPKDASLTFTGNIRTFIVYDSEQAVIPELYAEHQKDFVFTATDNQYVQVSIYRYIDKYPVDITLIYAGQQIESGVFLNTASMNQVKEEVAKQMDGYVEINFNEPVDVLPTTSITADTAFNRINK